MYCRYNLSNLEINGRLRRFAFFLFFFLESTYLHLPSRIFVFVMYSMLVLILMILREWALTLYWSSSCSLDSPMITTLFDTFFFSTWAKKWENVQSFTTFVVVHNNKKAAATKFRSQFHIIKKWFTVVTKIHTHPLLLTIYIYIFKKLFNRNNYYRLLLTVAFRFVIIDILVKNI